MVKMVHGGFPTALAVVQCILAAAASEPIDDATVEAWTAPYLNWHYYPQYVIPPSPPDGLNFKSVDCPLVWEHKGQWQMWYTGFDGTGYQTALAVSDDLIHWQYKGLVMGYGKPGAFDYGGVTFGGALFESYDIKAPRVLKRWQDRYWVLYGCYPRRGGYELRPGAQGLAWSEDGVHWSRASDDTPILSVNGAKEWERDCIYQPWLVEHSGKFWNFYNAANGPVEQMGLATSPGLRQWDRYAGNPIIRNGGTRSFDEQFCSDGKVFRDGDHWTMIYFGVGNGGAHIMIAFSTDLIRWTKRDTPLYQAGGHPGGLDAQYAHKVSMIHNPRTDTQYMFYCAVGARGRGIALLSSKPVEIPQ